jgi:hypothetical protein
MAQVIHDTPQEFWRPPAVREAVGEEVAVSEVVSTMAEACPRCRTEFLVGSRFCHACGLTRPEKGALMATTSRAAARDFLAEKLAWLQTAAADLSQRKFAFPDWLRYLHFHEIKRSIGLPMPSLVAFMIGLGCVLGMLGVSLFYRASNLAEFQAIQMWRVEWLLASIASFVAGLLLKRPSGE